MAKKNNQSKIKRTLHTSKRMDKPIQIPHPNKGQLEIKRSMRDTTLLLVNFVFNNYDWRYYSDNKPLFEYVRRVGDVLNLYS